MTKLIKTGGTYIFNYITEIFIFIVKISRSIKNFIRKVIVKWNRGISSQIIYLISLLSMITLFSIILRGMYLYFTQLYSKKPTLEIINPYLNFNWEIFLSLIIGLISFWYLLYKITTNTLAISFITSSKTGKVFSYIVKLLSTLPTLILGNAIIFLFKLLGFEADTFFKSYLFIIISLSIIGLPTTLHLGQELITDFNKNIYLQARSLGLNSIYIGKAIVIPSFQKTLRATVTLAVSRVIIEGYIIIDSVLKNIDKDMAMINDSEDLLDVFYTIYGTMTINSNAWVILIFFFIALFVNFSGYNFFIKNS